MDGLLQQFRADRYAADGWGSAPPLRPCPYDVGSSLVCEKAEISTFSGRSDQVFRRPYAISTDAAIFLEILRTRTPRLYRIAATHTDNAEKHMT
jgi:hypothetical protein